MSRRRRLSDVPWKVFRPVDRRIEGSHFPSLFGARTWQSLRNPATQSKQNRQNPKHPDTSPNPLGSSSNGPEPLSTRFNIIAVDCAKQRSKWMLCLAIPHRPVWLRFAKHRENSWLPGVEQPESLDTRAMPRKSRGLGLAPSTPESAQSERNFKMF